MANHVSRVGTNVQFKEILLRARQHKLSAAVDLSQSFGVVNKKQK